MNRIEEIEDALSEACTYCGGNIPNDTLCPACLNSGLERDTIKCVYSGCGRHCITPFSRSSKCCKVHAFYTEKPQ